MIRPLIALTLTFLALTACTAPSKADPALWRVDGPNGQRGYLFGTIHALDQPADWQTAPVKQALAASDRIVVEVANVGDGAAMAQEFQRLSHSPGQSPLSARVPPALVPRLTAMLAKLHMNDNDFGDVETWGAALALARALQGDAASANGVDAAVVKDATPAQPVDELEGATTQFEIFDRLPEADQRALLAYVVEDGGAEDEDADLAGAWRTGDMARIERATRTGMLANPALRDALYVKRNLAWTTGIARRLRAGQHPFVAVGAAHMAGAQGLPKLLAAQGFTVTRIE